MTFSRINFQFLIGCDFQLQNNHPHATMLFEIEEVRMGEKISLIGMNQRIM